ncbi:RBP11-like subunits of RNA polymerase [Hymenopellis radicata]|nr:RBP11-like subunits of RNA polymerase [Hymenopellis radicata]
MNAPERTEAFILDEGELPVIVTEDPKVPNAATFKIMKQDHTLGNMVRAQLLSMPEVLFAGYKTPHPLLPYFIIRVQTDGSITPQTVLENACKKLIGSLSSLEAQFKREFSFHEVEMSGEPPEANTVNLDPYGGTGVSGGVKYLDL